MGHKVSRHKSYAVCRVDGLPGQYRVIRQSDVYGSQPNTNSNNHGNGGSHQSHNLGVTADRKYVTSINDIGSKGIRAHQHQAEITQSEALTAKGKPKPKARKKKDINSNEKANGDLSKHEQPYPTKRKDSPKRDTVIRKSNGSNIHENSTLNQGYSQNGHDSQSNGTSTQERPQRVLPRASPSERDESKPKVTPRATSASTGERKQRNIALSNSMERDTHNEVINPISYQQPPALSTPALSTPIVDPKSRDDEPIPVSNVDELKIVPSEKKPYLDIDTPNSKLNGESTTPKACNDADIVTSHIIETVTPQISSSNSVAKDCEKGHHTLVSVVVHQPFTKPEPSAVPVVVLNGDKECLSDHEEIKQEDQIMLDDEPVNVAMFERASSVRSSQIKKSVAFSDDCVDIEHDLSRSYSRNGFHKKMDTVYGTALRHNDGDKWVTLDGRDATDFAPIQRQKVPGQSILKKSKYPLNEVPTLDLTESLDKSSNVKAILNNRKSDVDWDHIEDHSNPYPHGMVPVPATSGRMKGYHRPENAEMSRIKASNGTLADYIKQKSVNSHQAPKQVHSNSNSNGVTQNKITQNGGSRPQSSRGHGGDMSQRFMTSPRSSSADPRSRALSPSRVDTRGRVVLHDGQSRKVVNGYVVDPAVHFIHSPRGQETAIIDTRSKNRHTHPSQKQNVKLVISSGMQKPSKKTQHKHIMEQPKQHRNMVRQQWMVGNL